MKTTTIITIIAIIAAIGMVTSTISNTVFADNTQGQCNKDYNKIFSNIGVHGPLPNDIRKANCNQ